MGISVGSAVSLLAALVWHLAALFIRQLWLLIRRISCFLMSQSSHAMDARNLILINDDNNISDPISHPPLIAVSKS